jgi:N-acetylglucosaminyldiphosphoundecaprenol N-acetyl-beta-D-mannosaminyltransferase
MQAFSGMSWRVDRVRARPRATAARADILDCAIDRVDLDGALARVEAAIASRGYVQHMAINAAKLVAMQQDPELARVIRGCELVTADGQAVVWASRLLGDPLPMRVAGIDLMEGLLSRAAARGHRVYILGARQQVLEQAIERLHARHPGLQLVGSRNGYFAPEQEAEVAADIARARPDILFVAMSSPGKELFLGRHGPQLGVPFVMGVGGAIDVVSGITRRAPRAVQRAGLEWLFRLLQEPRRLFRRYAVTNVRFIELVLRDLLRGRLRSRAIAS